MRTESSGFILPDSLTFPELEAQLQAGRFHPIAAEVALKHLRAISYRQSWLSGGAGGRSYPWICLISLKYCEFTMKMAASWVWAYGSAEPQILSTNGPTLVPKMVFASNL